MERQNGASGIFAPGETEITISESGDVMTENGIIGRLKLVSFEDNQKLLKVAGTMFENVDGNNMQVGNNNAIVAQGAVEKSNVNAIEEMTRLIKVQRSYEYVQQMIDQEHDRLSNTISTYAQLA
jgi:flagellar basal-body rod protein FlgF